MPFSALEPKAALIAVDPSVFPRIAEAGRVEDLPKPSAGGAR